MTERMSRVQELLRTTAEICSMSDLYANALANGRNDIATLRSRGWVIDKHWTSHGVEAHVHYTLRSAPSRTASAKEAASAYQFSLFKGDPR